MQEKAGSGKALLGQLPVAVLEWPRQGSAVAQGTAPVFPDRERAARPRRCLHSCHQRVVDACGGQEEPGRPQALSPALEEPAPPMVGIPSPWPLCPVSVLRAQRIILWGCRGTRGADCSLGEAGRAPIPRKAFSFFESAVFCPNTGQERSCVLPRGLRAPRA